MKWFLISFFLLLVSCGTAIIQPATTNSLYEILTKQADGGAGIRFFEILSEEREINMLFGDESLKGKFKASDIVSSNFIIFNLGEQSKAGATLTIESVVETNQNVIVSIKETKPSNDAPFTNQISTPYLVVKINSKKEIVIQ